MNKLCRLVAMILLFLLLASRLDVSEADANLERTRTVENPGSTLLGSEVSFTTFERMGSQKCTSCSHYPITQTTIPLKPHLQRALEAADREDLISVIAYLEPRVDTNTLAKQGGEDANGRQEIVSTLRSAAIAAQEPVVRYLAEEQAAGRVSSYRSLWLLNGVAVRGKPSTVRALATWPSITSIHLDQWRQWVTTEPTNSVSRRLAIASDAPEPRAAGPRTGSTDDTLSVEWNVSRVGADEVWHTFHMSGTNAVVASMDTGVDWLHPALQRRYRGYNPHGPARHVHNWFDATEGGALYPVDGHGHGSHTLGTIVGEGGIGVAPGARWIGVRVLNSQGFGYDSWIHAGFQWLLAPGGDPAQAPDVVNCSWGNTNAYLTSFQEDLRVLRAAGILAVFSAGNAGPGKGSVGSPASLPEALAVGALDPYDEVATFSGRGPSPWGEIRPHVAAPGVSIRSSTPGGAYASMNGTSMAAPHVSGVVAMLRSISPTLSITHTSYLITSTAKTLGSPTPNNDTGWGRVDAFAAVASLAQSGFVTGTLHDTSETNPADAQPIPWARVTAVHRGGGGGGTATSAVDGTYKLVLRPGMYDMTASAFGYETESAWAVAVTEDTTTVRDFGLARKPTGTLGVRVIDGATHQPITATVSVLETPYEAVTDTHTFDLPAGQYAIRCRRLGYRVVTATVAIEAGETTTLDMTLPPAPSILLVDSGRWYYESQVGYFREALDDLLYAYDVWNVRHLPEDVPVSDDLLGYDVLIWSAPRDAPGYVGADEAVAQYLDGGGRLLLTGQDIGFWDGGGSGYQWSPYYRDYLKVRFVDDDAPTRTLIGEPEDIFSGQSITIAGPGGADNQDYPDVVSVADADFASPVLQYQSDGCGGVRVGTCLDYRAVYLPFGFEGINTRLARREMMDRSLHWLTSPLPTAGLELQPLTQLGIGPPGSRVTHTVRLRHTGQGGGNDAVRLTLQGASWPTELSETTVTLSSCASTMVTIGVSIPITSTWDLRDVITLTAHSTLSPTLRVSASLTSKTPAPILLVDDDRWYDQQSVYRQAMEDAGLPHDVWETSTERGRHGPGPEADTLRRYPVVVWWTGYDWYAPVTGDEISALEGYLDGGGRLMLSSQDFLYYHHDEPFTLGSLGVLTYTESVTPTRLTGVSENPVGAGLGPWALTYPPGYQNWSDGVIPAPDTGVAFRDQSQRGLAITRRDGKEATLFMAFPFEALPPDQQAWAMRQSVGWLSWLGRSTFDVDPRSARPGDTLTYTLSLHNDGPERLTATVSATLPAQLDLKPDTWVGSGIDDSTGTQLRWRGMVDPDETVTLSYQASVATTTLSGDSVVSTVHLLSEEHGIGFERHAAVRIGGSDLSRSTFACEPATVRPGKSSTCTVVLHNTGPGHADPVTARIYPPGTFDLAEDPVWTSLGLLEEQSGSLTWSVPLMAGATATLSLQLDISPRPVPDTWYGVSFLSDDGAGRWERPVWLTIQPWSVYLPLISRAD